MKITDIQGDFSQSKSKFRQALTSNQLFLTLDRKQYKVSRDIAFFSLLSASERTSVGKSIAKFALAGMAGQATKNDALGTAAMAGTAALGLNNKTDIFGVLLYFRSGKRLLADIDAKTVRKISALIPRVDSDEVGERIRELEREKRFFDDAPRTIIETGDQILQLEAKLSDAQRMAESGATFDERDRARLVVTRLEGKLDAQRNLYRRLQEHLISGSKQGDGGQGATQRNLSPGGSRRGGVVEALAWLLMKIFVIASLVLLPPLGIYLMFKGQHFYRPVRWAIAAFFTFVLVVALVDHFASENSEADNTEELSR